MRKKHLLKDINPLNENQLSFKVVQEGYCEFRNEIGFN